MKCPACGADNREGARFCRHCGEELAETAAIEAQAEGTAVAEAVLSLESEAAESLPQETEVEDGEAEGEAEAEPEPAVEVVEGNIVVEEPEATGAEAEEPPVQAAKAEDEDAAALPDWVEMDVDAEQELVLEAEVSVEVDRTEAEVDAGQEHLPKAEGDVQAFWREEAERLEPLEAGALLANRYLLIEMLDAQQDEVLYQAQDLLCCWQCGFEDNKTGDAFCAQCGASLDRKLDVRLVQVRTADALPLSGEPVAAQLVEGDRFFLVLAEREAEPRVQPAAASIRLLVGQRSDAGQIRELDEDSLLVLTLAPTYESRVGPVLGLFAVADGMGGHEGGEIASKMALQVLAERAIQSIILPELAGRFLLEEEIVIRLRQATTAANDAVYLARSKRENDMGTTLTAALIRDNRLFLAHVGDCRAYRWSAEGLEQLTKDHSVVASMIANGQASADEIYTHPHRSIIYRCIGDKPMVEVDTDIRPLAPGDRIVLCCDGLWEMIRNEGIEDVMMQETDPQLACDLLVKHANVAGGEDNISVLIVQVEET